MPKMTKLRAWKKVLYCLKNNWLMVEDDGEKVVGYWLNTPTASRDCDSYGVCDLIYHLFIEEKITDVIRKEMKDKISEVSTACVFGLYVAPKDKKGRRKRINLVNKFIKELEKK